MADMIIWKSFSFFSIPHFFKFNLLQTLGIYNNVPQCIFPQPVVAILPANPLEIQIFRIGMYHIARIKALWRLSLEDGMC